MLCPCGSFGITGSGTVGLVVGSHYNRFNDLLVHQREAVGRLAQLSATRTLMRVPEFAESRLSLTCALICDWRRHPIANQSWLQMPALLDFSISFVVNDTAELEVDPAPAPSLCLRKQCGCGWAVGWLDSKERREHTKSM